MDIAPATTTNTLESDDSDNDTVQGFELLLGGLNITDFSKDAWDNESIRSGGSNVSNVSPLPTQQQQQQRMTSRSTARYTITSCSEIVNTDQIFQFAHKINDGQVDIVPARLIDVPDKGLGLVANHNITKGTVIWTEKAAIATQTPNDLTLACQSCFKSLEPATRCCANSSIHQLPRPDLWPIQPVDFGRNSTIDGYRVSLDCRQCVSCNSLFCSTYCLDRFRHEYGSCCTIIQIVRELPTLLSANDNNDDNNDDDNEETRFYFDSSVVLAIKLFIFCINHHRKYGDLSRLIYMTSLCGEASDIDTLEIGMAQRIGENVQYTLQPVYDRMVKELSIETNEQSIFNLDFLHKLASQTARNGVDFCTQSPFKAYYQALLQHVPRQSIQRNDLLQQVARAITGSDDKLQRDMDRIVNDRVVPQVSGIFPLVGRVNHDCNPNAQVQSQVFCDAYIDVVALRDIDKDEEITISYLKVASSNPTPSMTSKRQRELRVKYLFNCTCRVCCPE